MLSPFSIKAGVMVGGLKPETLLAVLCAYSVYSRKGSPFVITSVLDGKHKDGSFHYKGLAVDLRLPRADYGPLPLSEQGEIRNLIAAGLGAEYDVILENTHIHIEFDPKATK